jgi:hypothetical protein
MSLKWIGWKVYTDVGVIYRRWEFEKDVPELKAEKGYFLDDLGPSVDPRFRIRDGAYRVHTPSVEELEEHLFNLTGFPRWRPPTTDGLRLVDGLKSLEEAIQAVTRATREGNAAHHKLNEVRKVLRGEKQEPNGSTKQNRFLRLKGEHEYSDGDPYRDWELLQDVLSIPASGRGDIHPRHAIKGDVLRELDDDELTPFQLRRDGRRIGDPEWWQVRHLFEGMEGCEEPKRGEASCPYLREVRRVLPEGPESIGSTAFVATRAVPCIGLRKGEVLINIQWNSVIKLGPKHREKISGQVHRVPRHLYQDLAREVDALQQVGEGFLGPEGLRSYLRNGKAQKGRDATSRILILRPLISPVSEPIQATSDDEAVFELLYQVTRGA